MFFLSFDFIIGCTWFNFQGQLIMNLEHDVLLNGVTKTSQGSPLHVVDYTNVYSGEIRVSNGDGVIQSKVDYNELPNRNLGEDEEELLQLEEQACNETLFVELEHDQNFVSLQIEQVCGHFFKLMTILLL